MNITTVRAELPSILYIIIKEGVIGVGKLKKSKI